MKINWADDAQVRINELVDRMLSDKLGPMMEAEVVRNTPVNTGALAESVTTEVQDHKLYIQAYGDELREAENRKYYAAWVDLGHHAFWWGYDSDTVQPPTAFMRRALYRRYPGF